MVRLNVQTVPSHITKRHNDIEHELIKRENLDGN